MAGSYTKPLSDLEIASYYRSGKYGFPKNVLKAISYYEKAGSADALYEIAVLFRTDKTLLDEDTYMEYLVKSADMGNESAVTELSLQYCMSEELSVRNKGKKLLEAAVGDDAAVGNFVIGYLIETGLLEGRAEDAFEYYVKAAVNSYKPAFARLCCGREGLNRKEELLGFYLETPEYGLTIAKYCMGCICFFGFGIASNKPKGIEFLVAADMGSEMAARALFTIFDIDPEYKDDEQALKWLKAVEKFDSSVDNELANRLLDGIGCKVSADNDLLAFELFKKAVADGDNVAVHNLGWMYKRGRGCGVDFTMARKLFEQAKRPNSFYNLGDMYENDLGCTPDIEMAIEYYIKGAEGGSRKSIERLKELCPDMTFEEDHHLT